MYNSQIKERLESAVFPVYSAEKILRTDGYLGTLSEIKKLSQLDDKLYNESYFQLIVNFANLVQCIPDLKNKQQLWLHISLERALIALKSAESKNKDQLFRFAVFSASLCLFLGKVITEFQVVSCDKNGSCSYDVCLLSNFISDRGGFYRMRPLFSAPKSLQQSLTLLLAYKVMPNVSAAWLAGDLSLLANWISALTWSDSDIGELNSICELSEEQIYCRKLELAGVPVEYFYLDEFSEAEKFWSWLKMGLKKGELSVNSRDSLLHILASGDVFLAEKLFAAYIKSKRLSISADKLRESFNCLGLAKNIGNSSNPKYLIEAAGVDANKHEKRVFVSSMFSQQKDSARQAVLNSSVAASIANQQVAGSLFSGVAAAQKSQGVSGKFQGAIINPGQLLVPLGVGSSVAISVKMGAENIAVNSLNNLANFSLAAKKNQSPF